MPGQWEEDKNWACQRGKDSSGNRIMDKVKFDDKYSMSYKGLLPAFLV